MNLIIQFTFYTNKKNAILYLNPVYDPDIIKSAIKITGDKQGILLGPKTSVDRGVWMLIIYFNLEQPNLLVFPQYVFGSVSTLSIILLAGLSTHVI